LEAELARHEQIVSRLKSEIASQRRGAQGYQGVDARRDPQYRDDRVNRALPATSEMYEVPSPSSQRKSLSEAALEMMHQILDNGTSPSAAKRVLQAASPSAGPIPAEEDEAVLLDFMMRNS